MDLEIIKIASDTDNNRNINNHTHFSKLRNSLCGDEMHIKLIIKDEKIVDFGYQGNSCIYCQASASLLSKNIQNTFVKNIDKIITSQRFKFLLGKKYLSRKDCVMLPYQAVKKAL